MSAREAALRAAVVKFFLDRLMDARKGINVEVTEHLDAGDRKHARLEDGTDVGTVSVSDPKGTTKVVNEQAFLAWVEQVYPTAVLTRREVSPAWQKSFLESLVVDDADTFDPDTGENVPGVERVTGSSTVTVRLSPEQKDALVEAFRDGRLAEHVREVVSDRAELEA